MWPQQPVERLEVRVCTIPTEEPESDGTLAWDATTAVVVHAHAAGMRGLGYAYTDVAAAGVVTGTLAPAVVGVDALSVPLAHRRMVAAVRNLGSRGIAASAIAAVDVALWDLKARILDLPLLDLLGAARDEIDVYASGGFTSYGLDRLSEQVAGWAGAGHRAVKIKIGRDPATDAERVRAARAAAGEGVDLLVDANGAYARKQALAAAERFAEQRVTWFEEPVSSDDLDGLRLVRDRAPAGMEITAGEYGWEPSYFRRMLASGAVDVLMADATRCAGITGFLRVAALCQSFGVPLSAHTAPALHLHACCATPAVRHLEWFHDHVLVERELFDGVAEPTGGVLRPVRERPGHGLELRETAAARYAA